MPTLTKRMLSASVDRTLRSLPKAMANGKSGRSAHIGCPAGSGQQRTLSKLEPVTALAEDLPLPALTSRHPSEFHDAQQVQRRGRVGPRGLPGSVAVVDRRRFAWEWRPLSTIQALHSHTAGSLRRWKGVSGSHSPLTARTAVSSLIELRTDQIPPCGPGLNAGCKFAASADRREIQARAR